jgi:hypothetical protein
MHRNRLELDIARRIARTLGHRVAAGYMRNRGWSFESALFILCGAAARS